MGIDEAGYGPNLGPLLISLTKWTVPNEKSFDIWAALSDIVTNEPQRNDFRFHIADSKQVYSPQKGLRELERSVFAVFSLFKTIPGTFNELLKVLTGKSLADYQTQPWFVDVDLELPLHEPIPADIEKREQFREVCNRESIQLDELKVDFVIPPRMNAAYRTGKTKGIFLSETTLALLRQAWCPSANSTTISLDKHGGRNRYADLLQPILDDEFLITRVEGSQLSEYRVQATTIRFETKSERHFPVAVASLIAKYVRELSMILFNQFWQKYLPDLKATKGYPQDAKRFRSEIADVQKKLQIPDDVLWRKK